MSTMQQPPAGVPAPPPPPALPEVGEGATFRVEKDGKVVTVGKDGNVVVTSTETSQPPIQFTPEVPPEAVTISIAFFVMIAVIIIGWPLARAFARRMDRAAVAPRVTAGHPERLVRIEQAVEAMAIEVERISENQRFVTRLLTEGRAPDAVLPRPAERIAERAADGEPDRR